MKRILQLLILFLTVIIFSALGNYINNGIIGIVLGGFTGLVLVNTIFSILHYKKHRFPLKALSVLLIILAFFG